MTDSKTPIAPVRKSVNVAVTPPEAFSIFTREFGVWWPLSTHSVALGRAVSVTFPDAVGEEIVETMSDGATESWGTVLELEPPHRTAFSWHPGRSSEHVTLVEVTFTSDSNGGTVVQLVHSGWECWDDGETQAAGYLDGWVPVLSAFVERADAR